jgi:tetratricopeptide (TPR) repeat protein
MNDAAWVAWSAAPVSSALLALFLWRGRMPGRLYVDALAIGLTLGAAVAVALGPFDLKANPLHFSAPTLAFLFAGLPEEGVKLIGVAAFLNAHYLARDRRDVAFAAGALSLGFATLENIFYLANAGAGWTALALERALTATPFHVFAGLAGGFAVAGLRRGAARWLVAWLGLGTIHGIYDFAVFAAAPGAAPEAFGRAVAAIGWDPVVALRAMLGGAEAAMAMLGGGAAAVAMRAPHDAPRMRFARFVSSRGLAGLLGFALLGGAVVALGTGALTGIMLETADPFLRAAIYAVMPFALGLLFVATSAPAWRRRTTASAAAFAAIAMAAAAWSWGPPYWRQLNALRFEARAARSAASGDYARAIDAYGQALAVEPARIEALAQRAEAYAALNRFDAALADVDAALRTAPGNVALYVERADLDRRRNAPAAAATDLDAALQRRPGDAELLAQRAQARLEAGDAAGAHADLAEASRKAPDNAVVRRAVAASGVDAGDFDSALRELNATLHANPADATAAFQRGRVWLYKLEPARARADFIRADDSPAFLYPALWRFLAEARLGGDAKANLRKRLAASPKKWPAPVARMLMGDIGVGDARAVAADDGERCEADFYFAMSRLSEDSFGESAERLRAVVPECPPGFIEYEGAKAELRRIAP